MAVRCFAFAFLVFNVSFIRCEYRHFEVPEKCKRPPPAIARPQECCNIPEVFSTKVTEECGIKKIEDFDSPGPNRTPNCTIPICLLKKHNLMNDEEVNLQNVEVFIDEWAEKNPKYKENVAMAKKICLKKPIPGPDEICEPHKIVVCFGATVFSQCADWKETPNCILLKNHIDECNMYLKHLK